MERKILKTGLNEQDLREFFLECGFAEKNRKFYKTYLNKKTVRYCLKDLSLRLETLSISQNMFLGKLETKRDWFRTASNYYKKLSFVEVNGKKLISGLSRNGCGY